MRTEEQEWASRVDSDTLAAALSIPRDSPVRRAAREEWDARYFCTCEHSIYDTEDPTWDGTCHRCARTVPIFRVRAEKGD